MKPNRLTPKINLTLDTRAKIACMQRWTDLPDISTSQMLSGALRMLADFTDEQARDFLMRYCFFSFEEAHAPSSIAAKIRAEQGAEALAR